MDKRLRVPEPILPLWSMGFFIFLRTQEWMMEMQTNHPHCVQHTGRHPKIKTAPDRASLDSGIAQSFQLLRLHAEGRALELAARLRVIGKSLAASCPGHGGAAARTTPGAAAYQNLRRQLDGFLSAMCEAGAAGQHFFPAIHYFLQQILPHELNGCIGDEACRIERVETIVSLLSDAYCENDEFTGIPIITVAL
jgi:hypothetical protein